MLKDFEPINIVFIFLGVLIGLLLTEIFHPNFEKENKELKMENHRLEQKLLKLYDEQAEQTKKIAELNGIGG